MNARSLLKVYEKKRENGRHHKQVIILNFTPEIISVNIIMMSQSVSEQQRSEDPTHLGGSWRRQISSESSSCETTALAFSWDQPWVTVPLSDGAQVEPEKTKRHWCPPLSRLKLSQFIFSNKQQEHLRVVIYPLLFPASPTDHQLYKAHISRAKPSRAKRVKNHVRNII